MGDSGKPGGGFAVALIDARWYNEHQFEAIFRHREVPFPRKDKMDSVDWDVDEVEQQRVRVERDNRDTKEYDMEDIFQEIQTLQETQHHQPKLIVDLVVVVVMQVLVLEMVVLVDLE